jgi:hypothetical protein
MKLIKLDRRHNLYHKGYTVAFVFERWSKECNQIESAVKQLEGYRWDNTFWGKSKMNKCLGYSSRPYYVGVKNESTATMALLKMEN